MSFFHPIGSKAVVCAFAHRPDLILTGHESGKIALFDAKTGDEVQLNEHAHRDTVTDLQLSPDRSYFITSSKDKTARVRLRCSAFLTMFLYLGIKVARDTYSHSAQNVYYRDPAKQRRPRAFQALCTAWRWSGCDECHDDLASAG